MKGQNFGLLFFLMVIGQVILCNFTNLGPYVMLTMLPSMILCVPLSISTPLCMALAFATGLATDWLSEGLIGINAASLIPVALMRKPLIRLFLGEDMITRKDGFSIRKNGAVKISMIMSISNVIFLTIYIFLDGAGIRDFWFNAARFGISFLCNFPLAMIVTNILTEDDRK